MVAEAAAGSGADALRYFVAEKYVRAFEALAANPSSRLVVVPMESASLAAASRRRWNCSGRRGQARRRRPRRPGASPWNRG
jgi:hypothetical protein